MKSSEYWARRMEALSKVQQEADDVLQRRIARAYDNLMHDLDNELSVFYARYAKNEGITMAEARKLLSNAELENFRISLDEFKQKAIAGGYDKELNEIYLRSRISRLQALEMQIELRTMELFHSQRDLTHDHLSSAFDNTYYRTIFEIQKGIGIVTTFARIDTETIENIIRRPWLENNFSGRIWKNRDKLIRELETTLSQAFVRGDPLERTAKLLARRMGVSKKQAMRLVATESAHISAQATARSYAETGVDEYDYLAAFDTSTCNLCGALDGMTFKRTEIATGINYPPMHPSCRCTTVPHIDTSFWGAGIRAARDPITGKTISIPGDMTFKQWKEKYVDKSGGKR